MCDFSKYGGPSDEWVKLEASLPPVPEMTKEQLKQVTNKGREDAAREEMKIFSSKVSIQDHSIQARDGTTLEARSYRPSEVEALKKLPIYIHFHGGGFFFGTLSSENATCSRIAMDVKVVVINVNYRHTPEFTYPTAWEDAEDTLNWVYENANEFNGDKNQIVVGGISACGMLTAALMQTVQRQQSKVRSSIKGQVLMIPCVVHEDCYDSHMRQMKDRGVSSYVANEYAPILPLSTMRMFNHLLFQGQPDPDDRRMNPGNASPEEVANLPPATFGICGLDPLRDEALLYAKLLQENGVAVDVNLFKGGMWISSVPFYGIDRYAKST